jgi:hypothetical protein
MDFDFDTGTIYGGLQTLDVTTLPPLGGQVGVLTVTGTGAIALPKGTTVEEPAFPTSGMFRYNTDINQLEYYDSTTWQQLTSTAGTVSSFQTSLSGLTPSTATTGAITLAGTLGATSGGTGTSTAPTAGQFLYSSAGTTYAPTTLSTVAVTSISGTAGNITASASTGAVTLNLDTVGTPVSASFVKITTDTFGRVTATTPVVQSDITTLVDGVYVNVAGDTMTGTLNMGGNSITNLPAPVAGGDAVNKDYADALANGLSWKQAVVAATTTNGALATAYENGDIIDGVTLTTGMRILIKNQTAQAENGIYVVQATGAPVRSTDMDSTTPVNEINGAAVFVEQGTANADTAWVQTADVVTLGVDPLVWVQFAGAGAYTAGNGLTLTGNQFSLTSPVSIANGGTALSTTPTNGQLLIGNGTGYTLATLTDGTAISITEGAGTITIDNTGVTSIAGTVNQITASAATGAVTLSVPAAFIAPGSVQVTTSLTVDTLTPNGALYAGTAGLVSSTAALTDGQILIGDTGSVPVAGTITGGTGVTVTNGAGTITIDIDNTEVVTSFSAGTTGFTPNTATTGAVTLAGTLNVANGGTGLTALGAANTVLGVNNAGSAAEYKTLTAGTGMSIVHGAGVVTFNNTGVTSVALSDASTTPIYGVTGSPVTTTGTLTVTLNTQTANTVFAGPVSGGAAQPTFRALTLDDLGTALQLYTENPATPTAPSATGDNAVAIGSGAVATAEGGFAVGSGSSARIYGQQAFANGSFATAGDAQEGLYVLRNITTDNTLTELYLDGVTATESLVLPNDSVFTFDILVAARRTDATGGGAAYRFVGVARKDATSGSITFIGTPSKTVIGETDNPWDAAVSVNTGNGSLRVRVTGQNAKTIRWVATVRTSEVTN